MLPPVRANSVLDLLLCSKGPDCGLKWTKATEGHVPNQHQIFHFPLFTESDKNECVLFHPILGCFRPFSKMIRHNSADSEDVTEIPSSVFVVTSHY